MKIKIITILIVSFLFTASPLYASGEMQVNQFPFTLMGTVIETNPVESLAVIKVRPKGIEKPYRVGESVCGYQIVKIKRAAIQILNEGKILEVDFPLGSIKQPVLEISDTQRIVNRQALAKQIPDLSTALQQLIGLPYFEGGKIQGFKIAKIKNRVLAKKAGLKEGDIVLSVNNRKLDTIKKPLEIYHDLRDESKITLQIKRKGEEKNLVYYLN
ncbi:MAG: PDZ domain-containing protein [Candidatus Omnitrophota bacterium]